MRVNAWIREHTLLRITAGDLMTNKVKAAVSGLPYHP